MVPVVFLFAALSGTLMPHPGGCELPADIREALFEDIRRSPTIIWGPVVEIKGKISGGTFAYIRSGEFKISPERVARGTYSGGALVLTYEHFFGDDGAEGGYVPEISEYFWVGIATNDKKFALPDTCVLGDFNQG